MANVNVSVLHPPPPNVYCFDEYVHFFLVNNKQEYIKV